MKDNITFGTCREFFYIGVAWCCSKKQGLVIVIVFGRMGGKVKWDVYMLFQFVPDFILFGGAYFGYEAHSQIEMDCW